MELFQDDQGILVPAWLKAALSYDKCEEFAPPGQYLPDRYSSYWMLSHEQLRDLHAHHQRGGRKPVVVSPGDWYGSLPNDKPSGLGSRAKQICVLFVAGGRVREIARLVGMTEAKVSQFLSSSLARWHCRKLGLRHRTGKFGPNRPYDWVMLRRVLGWGVKSTQLWRKGWGRQAVYWRHPGRP